MSSIFTKLKDNAAVMAALSFGSFIVFAVVATIEDAAKHAGEPERYDPNRMLRIDPDVLRAMRETGKVLKYKRVGSGYLYTLGSFDEDPVGLVSDSYREPIDLVDVEVEEIMKGETS